MSTTARRGDVWLVDFGEPIGHEQGYRRPAVVVSADRLNASRAGLAIVVPLTTRRRGLPSHVELNAGAAGQRETSYAKVEDVKSISTERLVRLLGRSPPDALQRIGAVAALLLEL